MYKAQVNRTDPVKERAYMLNQKMHFYETLEQLVHAHESEGNK